MSEPLEVNVGTDPKFASEVHEALIGLANDLDSAQPHDYETIHASLLELIVILANEEFLRVNKA